MKAGKLSQTVWRRAVDKKLNKENNGRLTVPAVTENCMAVKTAQNDIELVTSAAVSGSNDEICIYALAKAWNDLAARAGKMQGISAQIWLPEDAVESNVKRIVASLQTICEQKGVPILGIQAEVSPVVRQNFIQITAVGAVQEAEMIHVENIKPGQEIILCGTIGLEGILRILDEREEELTQRFVPAFIRQIKGLKEQLFLDKAAEAAKTFAMRNDISDTLVMQQIGSGGIFAVLWELAEASGVGMEIDLNQIAIRQETVEICEYYQLNPYQMTSTGAMLMMTDDGAGLIKVLEKAGARAVRLGVTTADSARVITSAGETRYMDRPAPDEWMRWYHEGMQKGIIES